MDFSVLKCCFVLVFSQAGTVQLPIAKSCSKALPRGVLYKGYFLGGFDPRTRFLDLQKLLETADVESSSGFSAKQRVRRASVADARGTGGFRGLRTKQSKHLIFIVLSLLQPKSPPLPSGSKPKTTVLVNLPF